MLVVVTAPTCKKGDKLIGDASQAAAWVDDFFTTSNDCGVLDSTIFSDLSLDPSSQLSKPLIGVLNSATVPQSLIDSLGAVTSYPALKCILTFDDEDDIVVWDYIGPRESAHDLYETVLMYWYRFVLSNAFEGHQYPTLEKSSSSRPPIFSFESIDEVEEFLKSHGDNLLRPAHARFKRQHRNAQLSEVFDFFMGGKHKDVSAVFHSFGLSDDSASTHQCTSAQDEDECNGKLMATQEVDPYILLIQCRPNDVDDLSQSQLNSTHEFDELAEEMAHRRDVAFFTIQTLALDVTCSYGTVLVLRVRRSISYSLSDNHVDAEIDQDDHRLIYNDKTTRTVHNITTNWENELLRPSHSILKFIPVMNVESQPPDTRMKVTVHEDPMDATEFIRSKLVPFVVTHTTPTVLWFDRHRTAQLAFSWYRKIHAVLVVDVGLSYQQQQTPSANPLHSVTTFSAADIIDQSPWPSRLNQSSEAAQLLLDRQRKAVQLFYNAALRHRVKYPSEDVVFLIIPSSETRILSKFGIDIWSPLDEALFYSKPTEKASDSDQANDSGYCSSSSSSSDAILPAMFLTDSSSRSGKQPSTYYMEDILYPSPISSQEGGAIAEFIDSFFEGTVEPFIRSDTINPLHNHANVTILTGRTFESYIMDRKNSHSMLLMQTITCGHCKRFSILWNEFSSLVQAMNWGHIIDVMKIDVSKNDVPHKKVDVWDVPSVYYFPAGEKDDPIEVTYIGSETNPQHAYDEGLSWIASGYDLVRWIIDQGKLDVDLLISLDESRNITPTT